MHCMPTEVTVSKFARTWFLVSLGPEVNPGPRASDAGAAQTELIGHPQAKYLGLLYIEHSHAADPHTKPAACQVLLLLSHTVYTYK